MFSYSRRTRQHGTEIWKWENGKGIVSGVAAAPTAAWRFLAKARQDIMAEHSPIGCRCRPHLKSQAPPTRGKIWGRKDCCHTTRKRAQRALARVMRWFCQFQKRALEMSARTLLSKI